MAIEFGPGWRARKGQPDKKSQQDPLRENFSVGKVDAIYSNPTRGGSLSPPSRPRLRGRRK